MKLEALGLARPEASAIKALASGAADELQQRLAFACIRQKLCIEDQLSYVSGDSLASAFNEGRRSVGVALGIVLRTDIKDFPEVDHGR